MEIKATLQKPYEESERLDFIIQYNHNLGYTIEETETELQALGYTKEELEQQEKERIQELFMTRSDFFDGIIKAFDIGSEELLNIIQNVLKSLPISTTEIKIAINNYKNALNFYRKHPLFKMLSDIEIKFSEKITAKFTEEQWDRFFIETNKKSPDAYKALLPNNQKE